jgi:hypothetical protein
MNSADNLPAHHKVRYLAYSGFQVAHPSSYGVLLGSEFFQSFAAGIIAYRALPRAQFATLQQATVRLLGQDSVAVHWRAPSLHRKGSYCVDRHISDTDLSIVSDLLRLADRSPSHSRPDSACRDHHDHHHPVLTLWRPASLQQECSTSSLSSQFSMCCCQPYILGSRNDEVHEGAEASGDQGWKEVLGRGPEE